MKTVPGIFKSGVVHLADGLPGLPEGPVLVTFPDQPPEKQKTPAMTPEQVAELRGKLAAWEADWNDPGMSAYDEP
jgi:hypothetical protein